MKAKEKIEKLKEGCIIECREIAYTTTIQLIDEKENKPIALLNKREFESLISKNIIKLESIDTKDFIHPNRTVKREIRKYIYNYEKRN